MSGVDVDAWHDLFVMSGGAATALAGLLFVAVSLNHEEILRLPTLPTLAAQSVSLLIALVIVSICALVPGQGPVPLGAELLLVAVVLAVLLVVPTARGIRLLTRLSWRLRRLATVVVSVAPLLVAGVLLLLGDGAGLVWAAAEVGIGIAAATYNAWILLIEIRR